MQAELTRLDPSVPWEVVNQATIHRYTGDVRPYGSIAEAMSRWVDPVTAVGVSLQPDGELQVIAPLGLQDLFEMVVRPNLIAPNAADIYRRRIESKAWASRWPLVRIEPLDEA